MSAGRQSPTTSLTKHAHATTSLDSSDVRNLDFCNAFWGLGDGGVDVLFARMRSAVRTTEELRSFWKERSTIEEEYAKRLAELARMSVGKDEIGELRNSIDMLRLETDKQAGSHLQLAQQIRTDLEGQVSAFVSKQQRHMKLYQTAIEKAFEVKQTREQDARRAREKYDSDCVRINSYMAQSTFMQGIDLQKIRLKLERAQQTVQANENEYAQCTRALQETMQKWEQDWKAFCDSCQDLEEERIEFTMLNMWAYTSAMSTACVGDAESSERLRLTFEQLETKKDMEDFVRDYGTGNEIPEPPMFVNYANIDTPPVSSSRVATRPANFIRHTQKANRATAPQDANQSYEDTNFVGVGAGGSGGPSHSMPTDVASLSRNSTQKSTTDPHLPLNAANGLISSTPDPQRHQSVTSAPARPVSDGDPVDPMVSGTQLIIRDRTWEVDPNKDPQQQVTTQVRASPAGEQDLLVKKMAELSTTVADSGHGRRNTIHCDGPPSSLESRGHTGDSLLTPSTRMSASTDPIAQAPSRSASANPPKVVLAPPPPPLVPPSAPNIPIERIASAYQRPFPGEPRWQAGSYVEPAPPVLNQTAEQNLPSPTNGGGYSGVNIQLFIPRPSSPALAGGPSPTVAVQPYNREPPAPPALHTSSGPHHGMSVSHRPVTPTNTVGITPGPDRSAAHGMMAQQPFRHGSVYSQLGPPPPQPTQPQSYPAYHGPNRALTQPQQQQPSPSRNDYTVVASHAYGGSQPYNYDYGHPARRPGHHDEHLVRQPAQTNYNNDGAVAQPVHQQSQSVDHVAANAAQQRYRGNTSVPRSASPGIRQSPSLEVPRGQPPPPTGAYTDSGRPILFYVKALYDYAATIDEEFDFQAGDIIAVTETPEDGWWSGELLDDSRTQAGRHVFPSNFVCLF